MHDGNICMTILHYIFFKLFCRRCILSTLHKFLVSWYIGFYDHIDVTVKSNLHRSIKKSRTTQDRPSDVWVWSESVNRIFVSYLKQPTIFTRNNPKTDKEHPFFDMLQNCFGIGERFFTWRPLVVLWFVIGISLNEIHDFIWFYSTVVQAQNKWSQALRRRSMRKRQCI